MGLGAYPASGENWLGMLGMHGTFEANNAMHDCDLMICVGARFDDRITGRLDQFSPGSTKIHIDIDPSSINKNVKVDLGIVGDCAHVMAALLGRWRARGCKADSSALKKWWAQIAKWRARKSLSYKNSDKVIKPQWAIDRLYAATKGRDCYITTEVGQHQMWAAQHYHFEAPNRWMTSGGLGTMGYGLPAAIGVQMAHPNALVIDIAGEGSILMNIQELSTAAQYPCRSRCSSSTTNISAWCANGRNCCTAGVTRDSYSEALPDFVKLAQSFGAHGIRCSDPADLDAAIAEMINTPKTVVFDCRIDKTENCLPMIPSGKAHNEMILPDDEDLEAEIDAAGKALV